MCVVECSLSHSFEQSTEETIEYMYPTCNFNKVKAELRRQLNPRKQRDAKI
jgi:hypothetical protein